MSDVQNKPISGSKISYDLFAKISSSISTENKIINQF
uniref:Uncharacterized protein n=1 Tax=Anguilla anguilla TaxID=7936 RepID=A0A0E9SNM8_ANGAN